MSSSRAESRRLAGRWRCQVLSAGQGAVFVGRTQMVERISFVGPAVGVGAAITDIAGVDTQNHTVPAGAVYAVEVRARYSFDENFSITNTSCEAVIVELVGL